MRHMRVTIIAKSKRHTLIYHYFKKAFESLGHQALWIKYPKLKSYIGEKLATAITEKVMFKFKPDLLFFHGTDLPYELLLRAREHMLVVMYYDDCMKISGNYPIEVINFGKQCDIMYITNRGEIPNYKEWGVNAMFITGGCDKDAHRAVKRAGRMYQSDVAFIGKPNTPERVECMREVGKRFDLKLWGSGWERFGLTSAAKDIYADGYRKICAGAKIILGWNIDPTVDLYFSNRTWYTLGCGGFLLTLYSPSLEEIFERGGHLDWFETVEECCEKIEHYLQNSEKRKKISQAGYELAHREYSYEKMVEKILGNLPKK